MTINMNYCAIQNTLTALVEDHGDNGCVLDMLESPDGLSVAEQKAALQMLKLFRDRFEALNEEDFQEWIFAFEEELEV